MKFFKTFLAITSFLLFEIVTAQEVINVGSPSLKLSIKAESGTNGSGVAYNSRADVYYTVIAGNPAYPIETFDASGNNLFSAEASNDMRGIWFNPKSKSLQGNCYNDGGIVEIGLNSNSYATGGNKLMFSGKNQPDVNSCGTYNSKKKEIVYYSFNRVLGYSAKTGAAGKIDLRLNIPVLDANINTTSLIYTGEKNMEYGLLDYVNKQVLLFNAKNGEYTATINLPSDAITHNSFRFSYANGYIFLYDVDSRSWSGYKVF